VITGWIGGPSRIRTCVSAGARFRLKVQLVARYVVSRKPRRLKHGPRLAGHCTLVPIETLCRTAWRASLLVLQEPT
jgi:hypothetical protein